MNFFLLQNTKEDILKNVENQSFGSRWLPLNCFLSMQKEVNGNGYQHFSKHLLLCSSEERNSYKFETKWGWWQNFHFWVEFKTFKGLVHPKMKIMSLMTHPHVSFRYFRFSLRVFCPSVGNVCMVYCPCPERK